MKVDFGVAWSDSGRMWSDRPRYRSRVVDAQWEAFNCMDTCHHLYEGQFLTITDAPVLSLAGSCRREVERAKLVEILKCLDFFSMSVSRGGFGS